MRLSGMRAFTVFGLGQVVSIFGTSLSGFALSVWVFEQTQSVMQFALVALFITAPSIVFKPIAGALVDRWDRRYVLIGSDLLAALMTVLTVVLVRAGALTVSYIYLMTLVLAIASAFQLPASSAAIQLLVPPEQFGRANGAVGAIKSISTIVAPLVAGALLAAIGLEGVLLIDLLTFLVAMTTLLLIAIPRIRPPSSSLAPLALLAEITEGWRHMLRNRELLVIAAFSMLIAGVFETARILLTPLLLSYTTTQVLGAVTSAAGVGALIGNLVMVFWGGPRRKMYGVVGFLFVIGVCLVLGGLRQSTLLIGAAVVVVMAGIPIVWTCIEAIWLKKVPPSLIGRVKSTSNTFDSILATLALLGAGLFADGLFEPWMLPDGALASSVGALIGVGPGRGVALMLIVLGGVTLLAATLAALNPAIRLLEDTLPDVDLASYVETGRIPATE